MKHEYNGSRNDNLRSILSCNGINHINRKKRNYEKEEEEMKDGNYKLYLTCYKNLNQRKKMIEHLLERHDEVIDERNRSYFQKEADEISRRMDLMRKGAERHEEIPNSLEDWLKQDTYNIGENS